MVYKPASHLKRIQRLVTGLVTGFHHAPYEVRLLLFGYNSRLRLIKAKRRPTGTTKTKQGFGKRIGMGTANV